jgi:hypothetical protein
VLALTCSYVFVALIFARVVRDRPMLPNSVIETAIQFETFVVMAKNHVRGSTNKILRTDHELLVEAIT